MNRLACLAALAAAGALCTPAQAQMFHLYLDCKGSISAGGKNQDAQLYLALRDNNMTALVQRSNVLPVGERMKYQASSTHYTAVYTSPLRGTAVYSDWYRSWLFVWYPAFERLRTTRLSIDRNSGDLEGEMVDAKDDVLGRMKMMCEPKKEADQPQPRF